VEELYHSATSASKAVWRLWRLAAVICSDDRQKDPSVQAWQMAATIGRAQGVARRGLGWLSDKLDRMIALYHCGVECHSTSRDLTLPNY
jgi:hypothetical protein